MLADFIWAIVIKWNRLAQETVGRQLIKAGDSIGANIAEGSGRGSFADNREIRFKTSLTKTRKTTRTTRENRQRTTDD